MKIQIFGLPVLAWALRSPDQGVLERLGDTRGAPRISGGVGGGAVAGDEEEDYTAAHDAADDAAEDGAEDAADDKTEGAADDDTVGRGGTKRLALPVIALTANKDVAPDLLEDIRTDMRESLQTLVEHAENVEHVLYNINTGSQSHVNVLKGTPDTAENRDTLLNELYSALQTRCSSGSELLQLDFRRRNLVNRLTALDSLVVDAPECHVEARQPLRMVAAADDVIVDACAPDADPHMGQLTNSSLTVITEGGNTLATWAVAAMTLPFKISLSLPPCFTFGYLGTSATLCAPSLTVRDQWIQALAINHYCLSRSVGGDVGALALPLASEVRKPGKAAAPAAAPPPAAGDEPAPPTATTPAPGPPGTNFYVGWDARGQTYWGSSRDDLVAKLLG